MKSVERAVIIFSADGSRILFTSPRCLIDYNSDSAVSIIDMSDDKQPVWLRVLGANSQLLNEEFEE